MSFILSLMYEVIWQYASDNGSHADALSEFDYYDEALAFFRSLPSSANARMMEDSPYDVGWENITDSLLSES